MYKQCILISALRHNKSERERTLILTIYFPDNHRKTMRKQIQVSAKKCDVQGE